MDTRWFVFTGVKVEIIGSKTTFSLDDSLVETNSLTKDDVHGTDDYLPTCLPAIAPESTR